MTDATAIRPDDAGPQQIETILDELGRLSSDCDAVSFGRIVETLGARSYAPLLLVLAILLVLPTGMIPGMGGAIGLVKIAIGLQVLRGRSGIWLPRFVRDREIPADRLRGAVDRLRPLGRWLRNRLRPRWTALAEGRLSLTLIAAVMIATGAGMLVMGFIPVIAPVFGLPALCLALGVVSRDGRMVAAGYALMLLPPVVGMLWVGAA